MDSKPTAQLVLKRNQDRRVRSGHPWVFSNEVAGVEGSPADGPPSENGPAAPGPPGGPVLEAGRHDWRREALIFSTRLASGGGGARCTTPPNQRDARCITHRSLTQSAIGFVSPHSALRHQPSIRIKICFEEIQLLSCIFKKKEN